MIKNKLLVILGPTATGKTGLGIYLAKKFNGELVACDSRQVYKGLDIGTGKYPGKKIPVEKYEGYWIIDGIKVWIYDMVGLDYKYNVADYCKDAEKVISNITSQGKLPIIVGGTGFYLKGLLEGLSYLNISVDEKLREEFGKLGLAELQEKLLSIDLYRWENMNNSDRQNKRRLLRSIELSMNPYIGTINNSHGLNFKYEVLKVGLTAPRKDIFEKVDLRILDWLNEGIIDEVKDLIKQGLSFERLKELGLEYAVIASFIKGEIKNEKELVEKIKGKLHGYVRRQEAWFKLEKDVFWIDISKKDFLQKVENKVLKWYHLTDAEKN